MRFFIADLMTETNSFAPLPTGMAGFDIARPGGEPGAGIATALGGMLRQIVKAEGHNVGAESLFAFAQPSGKTLTATYESLRDEILDDLRKAEDIDAVLLVLHGAMIAFGYDDCEGDLLAQVREIVGPGVPVGAMLDPHMHLTGRMLAHAGALVLMKEYPHTDGPARAQELCRILARQRRGEIKPVSAVFDCRMLGMYPTTAEPMRGFVRRMQAIEHEPGILSVSLAHGFPWADVADMGSKLLVIADGDPALAQRWAEPLGREFYALRHALAVSYLSPAEVLATAARETGLSVIADAADNAGGGAPSDNTALLRELLRQRLAPAALGALYDPAAPLDVLATVTKLSGNLVQKFFGSMTQPMGRSAAIEVSGVHIVLCSLRAQTYSPDIFTQMGIALEPLRCVVVKSTQHFEAAFEPLAARVLRVAVPGAALDVNFADFTYTQYNARYFPRESDPLKLE
ncbi:MAG: M81 family metallopeptidase [Nevskiales bacterium]